MVIQTVENHPDNNTTLLIKMAQGVSDSYLAAALYCILEKHQTLLTEPLLHVFKKMQTTLHTHFSSSQVFHNLLTQAS
ncbi:MAG: hypothetical protein KTR20_05505 [Cellvibrionaceae bacterium]|nr:hypothetical protein [Cellvibrionaceae bacterium]